LLFIDAIHIDDDKRRRSWTETVCYIYYIMCLMCDVRRVQKPARLRMLRP